MIKVTFEIPKVEGIADDLERELMEKLSQAQQRIVAKAEDYAPVRSGELRSSVVAEPIEQTDNGYIMSITATAPHAAPMEYGTGIFTEAPDATPRQIVIIPVKARALSWEHGGKRIFARKVVQQGLRPRAFIRRAIDETQEEIMQLLDEVAEEVLRRMSAE